MAIDEIHVRRGPESIDPEFLKIQELLTKMETTHDYIFMCRKREGTGLVDGSMRGAPDVLLMLGQHTCEQINDAIIYAVVRSEQDASGK